MTEQEFRRYFETLRERVQKEMRNRNVGLVNTLIGTAYVAGWLSADNENTFTGPQIAALFRIPWEIERNLNEQTCKQKGEE